LNEVTGLRAVGDGRFEVSYAPGPALDFVSGDDGNEFRGDKGGFIPKGGRQVPLFDR
jgi:hypothetical protein